MPIFLSRVVHAARAFAAIVSKLRVPLSLARFAWAPSRLTYETATRMPTLVVPGANVTYPPEPLPAFGRPVVLYPLPPLSSVPPGVRVASFHVPVAANG